MSSTFFKFKVTQLSAERVSVLDDIEVSPTAIACKRTEVRRHPLMVTSGTTTHRSSGNCSPCILTPMAGSDGTPTWTKPSCKRDKYEQYHSVQTCPFTTGRKEPPRKNYATEKAIQGLQMDMQNMVDKCKLSFAPNITLQEKKAIADLRTKDDTIITRSDKGGELVVTKESWLKELCLAHLSDKKTYKRLNKDPTNDIRLLVNRTLQEVLSRSEVPESVIDRLIANLTAAKTQRFYALPKSTTATTEKEHKLETFGRIQNFSVCCMC